MVLKILRSRPDDHATLFRRIPEVIVSEDSLLAEREREYSSRRNIADTVKTYQIYHPISAIRHDANREPAVVLEFDAVTRMNSDIGRAENTEVVIDRVNSGLLLRTVSYGWQGLGKLSAFLSKICHGCGKTEQG